MAGCKIRWFDGLSGRPEKSQKEGQEDKGVIKQPGGITAYPWVLSSASYQIVLQSTSTKYQFAFGHLVANVRDVLNKMG